MALKITTGRIAEGVAGVFYGPPGVGKSELAALLPSAVFIDVEGSTNHMSTVNRLPKPSSFSGLLRLLNEFLKDPMGFRNLVIDSADWVDTMVVEHVCAKLGINTLGAAKPGEKGDFGQSYNAVEQEWCQVLNVLSEIRKAGVNVIFTAHSVVKKREVPEEFGAFDFYNLKMEKKSCAKLVEWAQYILFLNYQTYVVTDEKTKTKKGTGGARFIHTSRHVCWEAKSRSDAGDSLPEKIAYERGIFPAELLPVFDSNTPPVKVQEVCAPSPGAPTPVAPAPSPAPVPTGPLAKVRDLMASSGVTDSELIGLVAERGFFPANTLVDNLPGDFLTGWVLVHWKKIETALKGETANV